MLPATDERNLTPSSTAAPSGSAGVPGTVDAVQIVHGQICATTLMTTLFGPEPSPAGSRLPLSSKPRDLMVPGPVALGVQSNVQAVVPVARCHVVPPSTDTSTPATTPPPA